jgi:hypothetical protein
MMVDESELLKLRLDYAWKYFESASRNRMQFINYFFIAVGILANAFAVSVKEDLYAVACYVCIFGFLASLSFMMLDRRMLSFVVRALDVLETLEREELFQDGMVRIGPHGELTTQQLGLARAQPDEHGRFWRRFGDVRFWVRIALQGSAAIGFSLGFLYALVQASGG